MAKGYGGPSWSFGALFSSAPENGAEREQGGQEEEPEGAREEGRDRLPEELQGERDRALPLHPDGPEGQVNPAVKPLVDRRGAAPSRGRFFNSGNGPALQPIDIGHPDCLALIEPRTAFWSLVGRDRLGEVLLEGELLRAYWKKAGALAEEKDLLRVGLTPSP